MVVNPGAAEVEALPVKSANRALDIFELLAAEAQGLTVAEISDKLGLARSSTHGLVRTLHSRGYLMESGVRRYHLGARLIQLGLNVADRLELRTAARPPLERIVAATHDTALLVVPEAGDLLFVDKVLSNARNVRTDPRFVSRHPLHCSSLGKALLAALDDESVLAIIDEVGLDQMTEHSLASREDLLADLARTRSRGYSVDRQEALIGVWCVGAPVRDHTGKSIAAVSLSTIREFFDPDTAGPRVAAAAVEISRQMGWKGDATTLYEPVAGSEVLLHAPRLHAGVGGG
jgi:IclR family transcriptional regulator, KDG regulon repressor